jgi:hypothetical protein
MDAAEKRLNEMNRLGDMLHFPPLVNAGATLNVVLTIAATWWFEPRHPGKALVWIAVILAANLTPVLLLRLTLGPKTVYPKLGEMGFFGDQHKFSDWVYLAASANMTFWIVVAWRLAYTHHYMDMLMELEVAAAILTFSPVLLRGFLSRKPQA